MTRRSSHALRQWGWPIGLAAATLLGLLSALIGEGGLWWRLSWIALAMPLLVIARHWLMPWLVVRRRLARKAR